MMKHIGPPGFHADAPAVEESYPAVGTRWFKRIPWLFVAVVVVPTLAAAVYYFLIAAPLYVSEARFVVRSKNQGPPAALGGLLSSVGVSLGSGQTDAFEVHEYMLSRDAVGDLSRRYGLRALLDRPESDILMRFPRPFEGTSFENLYKNYKRFVTVVYDSQTGISTLRVRGFRPADAQTMANALLNGGEMLVNRLNDRSMADAVAQAQREVLEAEVRGNEAEAQLTGFRNRERLIDPERSSVAGLDLLGRLETQLASMRAERAGLAASAPESPQLPVLDRRIAAFSTQLEAERSRTAGQSDSLAPKVGEYERLTLERDLSVKILESAVANLESARMEARRKQLYLERVVMPDLPDKAEEPKRLRTVFTVLVASMVAYGVLSLIIAGLREHRQQ
jgi:capsular polysaccharide transport system permease protein